MLELRQSVPRILIIAFLCIATVLLFFGLRGNAFVAQEQSDKSRGQSQEVAMQKSAGCMSCHSPMDEATMHPTKTVQLGCTDCHGGTADVSVAPLRVVVEVPLPKVNAPVEVSLPEPNVIKL